MKLTISRIIVGLAFAMPTANLSAATLNVGSVPAGQWTQYLYTVPTPGSFSDILLFTMPSAPSLDIRMASYLWFGYSSVVFSEIRLYQNPDRIVGNEDDLLVGAADGPYLLVGPSRAGPYYLTVDGFTTGGGTWLNVAAFRPGLVVPEPETYALMFAGLAAMSLIVRRSRGQKSEAVD